MSLFLDSNIVLYALGTDQRKRHIARALLAEWPILSTQVINECSHVLRRKLRLTPADVREQLGALIKAVHLSDVGMREIHAAWLLAERYGYSHFDSLIVASALAAQCSILYSEDMQHNQVIDGRLTIINPFLGEAL